MSQLHYVPYPPTSFPFRDLLVLEQLDLSAQHRVCEIGVGSGGTTARLARMCREVVGFEISSATVSAIRYVEARHWNLKFVVADVTNDDVTKKFKSHFDRLIASDTLEHVSDPAAFFRAVSTLLAPGGSYLVTFPNEPKDRMHGITRFDSAKEIVDLALAAGLEVPRIGAARLAGPAEKVANTFGWKPIKMVRKVLRRGAKSAGAKADGGSGNGGGASKSENGPTPAAPPQTFDQTHFFKRMNTWRRLSPVVNLYWYGVLRGMESQGPAFDVDWDFREEPFHDCQVVVRGEKRR